MLRLITDYGRIFALLILVVWAAIGDIRTRKIPNRLTASFALLGFSLQFMGDVPRGAITSILGLVAGLIVFLLPYLMGAMGAGDVKLMAAIGALSNWRFVLVVMLFTALAGGIVVLARRAIKGGLWRTLKRMGHLFLFYLFSLVTLLVPTPALIKQKEQHRIDTSDKEQDYMPYAVAIALGSVITLVLAYTGTLRGLSI